MINLFRILTITRSQILDEMMRKLAMRKSIFLFSIVSILSGNIYAEATTCPPPDVIKQTQFTNIVAWEVVYASPFTYKGETWNVWMGGNDIFRILDEEYNNRYNVGKAFTRVQAYFDAIASFENNYPTPEKEDSKRVVCKYTANKNLSIVAHNPARIIVG